MRISGIVALLAILAASAAAAKNLPRGRIDRPLAATGCEAFGSGFRKLEGSDSCVKIDGQVRVESTYTTSGGGHSGSGSLTGR